MRCYHTSGLLVLGLVVSLSCTVTHAAPVDILTNGSLEPPYSVVNISNANGNITGMRPVGWQDNSTSSATHTDTVYAEETTGTVSGSALKITTAVQGGQTSGASFQMFQNVPSVAGRSYTAKVWLKGSQSGTVAFRLRQSASPFTVRVTTNCAVTTEWQQFTLNLNALANETLRLDVHLNNQPMTLWIDEISLTVADGNRDWYVSPNGLDTNDGSIGSPFQTLARGMLSVVAGDTLWLRAGLYRETLTATRSGTVTQPITIAAYSGETVQINGCDVLSGPWSLTTNGIYTADVAWDLGEAGSQVFVDGVMQHQARMPNFGAGDLLHPSTTSVTVTNADATTNPSTIFSSSFDGGRPADFFVGARFAGLVGAGWAWQHAQITASAGGLLTFDAATRSGWWWPDIDGPTNTSDPGTGYVYGLLSLLDADGEWHLQRNASAPHTLHLRITGGVDPSTHSVEMKRRDWCVDVNNFNYIQVRGIDTRAGAVRLNGTGNRLEDAECRFLSHYMYYAHGSTRNGGFVQGGGVVVSGSGSTVRGCTIYDTAGCGINASGTGHVITRNHIYNTDYAASYANCVNLSGTGHSVTFNTAHHSGRDIIVPGGSGHEVRYNDFSYPGQMCKDLGVLYVYATNARGVIGPPTRIANNWVHDNLLGGASPLIYLDNFSRNFLVDHNVCWNGIGDSGVRLNGPNDGHLIYHNTLFNCDDANTHTYTLPNSNEGNPDPTFFYSGATYTRTLTNNLFLATTPQTQLVDASTQDFRLTTGAVAIDTASVLPGVNDGYIGAAPDSGAYESGGAYWVPGVNGWPIEETGVRADATTEIGVTRARLVGTLVSAGTTPASVVVFWGTSDAGTSSTGWQNQAVVGSGLTGSFVAVNHIVNQLVPATPYFVRFRSGNASGEAWSDVQTFQTATALIWDAGGGESTNLSLATNWISDAWPNLSSGLDVATFGNAGSTAVVDAATSLRGIVLNRDANFTLADGAGSLTLGVDGITMTLPTTTARTHAIEESDIVLGADQTWSITNNTGAAVLNVASSISGVYGFTKAGSGMLNLSGSSSYDGTTQINVGVLAISNATALGSVSSGTSITATGSTTTGGQLRLSGDITVAENIIISGTTEAGSFLRAIDSTSGTNTLSGSITLVGTGQVRIGPAAGTLQINGSISRQGSDVGALMLAPVTGATMIISQPMDTNGSQFNVTGGGMVVLNASSTDLGHTTIFFGPGNPNGPVLKLGVNNALPTSRSLTLGTTSTSNGADKGTLDLAGYHQTLNALTGLQGTGSTPSATSTRRITNSAPGTTSVLTVGNGNASSTFHGLIEDGAGKVALVKTGNGILTLPTAHTYTGDTTVNAGTLSMANATLADAADVNLTTGSVLNLTFTGTDTIDQLRINGLAQASGTWGSLTSTATNKTALITGDGLIQVTGPQPAYDAWALSGGLDGTAGKDAAPAADPDGDGVINFLEYATAMTPLVNDTVQQSVSKEGGTLEFFFTKNKSATDVSYVVEWSDDLILWSASGVSSPTVLSDNGGMQQVKVSVPTGGMTRRFVHLKVTQ